MAELLHSLTDIITTHEADTPYGAIPADTAGTIISHYDHGAYLVDFEALVWQVLVGTASTSSLLRRDRLGRHGWASAWSRSERGAPSMIGQT